MKAKKGGESASPTQSPLLMSLRALLDTPNSDPERLWRALSEAPDSALLALGTPALPALAEVLLAPLPAPTLPVQYQAPLGDVIAVVLVLSMGFAPAGAAGVLAAGAGSGTLLQPAPTSSASTTTSEVDLMYHST